jgi:hypothetical protein
MSFHKRASSGRPLLGETVTFENDDFRDLLIAHPDPEIDLACFLATDIANPPHEVYWKSLRAESLANFEEPDLLPGAEVWFVGYPENRFDTAHNLPLLRRGYIASIPTVDFNRKPQFVIDAQVFPGSSGSPVFVFLGGQYRLVGVVSQTMIRNEELQALPTGIGLAIEQVLGLGMVIKAQQVVDLLEHAKTQLQVRAIERGELSDEAAPTPELDEREAS